MDWTLSLFENKLKIVVFANEVKQSSSIFDWSSDLDCFANARNDGLLINFIKRAKVQIELVIYFLCIWV